MEVFGCQSNPKRPQPRLDSLDAWLNNAARAAARAKNAAAYIAWEASRGCRDDDLLDAATSSVSLHHADW